MDNCTICVAFKNIRLCRYRKEKMSDCFKGEYRAPETPNPISSTEFAGSAIGFSWSEELEPLKHPADHSYSCYNNDGASAKYWRTWDMESHIERLYKRCDSLLQRLSEQEKLILNLTVKP